MRRGTGEGVSGTRKPTASRASLGRGARIPVRREQGRGLDRGGPGTAGLYTYVYLKRTIYSIPPETILAFDENSVTLSEASALNLTMKWVTPSHLDVTYNGRIAIPYFQVVKCLGIDISASDTSSEMNNISH
jgi:hypothetical protein